MNAKRTPEAAAAVELSGGLRGYLYLTSMVTGAAIMIVEILGAKMLSPYVGTSHYVWTAQIATALVALSAGYWFGGRMADAAPGLGRLYTCILVAALWLAASVPLCGPLAFWALEFPLGVGTLLASGLLYFVPLALLAVTCPFLVRVLTRSLAGVGQSVGRLTAISTLGSVLGTVLVAHVFLPLAPNSLTMVLTTAALFLVVLVWVLVWRKEPAGKLNTLGFIALGLGGGWAGHLSASEREPAGARVLLQANSNFGELLVYETPAKERVFLNDHLSQGSYDLAADKSTSIFSYALGDLARAYAPRIDSALCIGLGIGIVPMEFAAAGARVDVVEINPGVVHLAEEYFAFDPARAAVHVGDGRHFLNGCEQRYDVIVLDAFLGDSSPSHLMTEEAFRAMRQILAPGGVLVINSFVKLERGKDFLGASLAKTLREVFRTVLVHSEKASGGNVFWVAGDEPLLARAHAPDPEAIHPRLRERVLAALTNTVTIDDASGIVLTDDFNPVEIHDAANREELRRALARHAEATRSK